jgi:hypothetical protein
VTTDEAIDRELRRAPAVSIPPTFAADVARRARLEAPPAVPMRGPQAGLVAAAALIALIAGWMAASDGLAAAVPVAALVLAGGEAIVLALWLPGLRRA